jgi:uncharacterized protein
VTSVVLFLAAVLGGALNAVAGGGSFIGLPALLFSGVPPVAANATTAFALWPASLSSVFAYRREVVAARRWLIALGATSLVGGFLGGLLLVHTSDTSFVQLLPWLMLLAAVTFTFGDWLTRRLAIGARWRLPSALHVPYWLYALQLLISIYGGYFGGGMGIMTLALLSISGMTNIHEMNGLKVALAAAINGVALAAFIAHGLVAWQPGLLMAAGGMFGGYTGAAMARRIDGFWIRVFVAIVAWGMTGYFFLRT